MRQAKRLSVKSFVDAMKQIRAARAEIEKLQASGAKDRSEHESEYRKRLTAEADAKSTHEQFADLKKRLFDSEQECARLRGYMERVREDDAVADPMVEVEDGGGKRMVSKRYPSNAYLPSIAMSPVDYDNYGRPKPPPKHWVTY